MSISAPTLVGSLAETANTNTAHAIPVANAVTSGKLVIVTIVESNATHTFTIADSKSNTWHALTKASSANTQPCSSQMWWSVLTTGLTTSDTITVTGNSAGNAVAWAETIPGADTGTPIAVDGTGSNTSGQSTAWASTSLSCTAGDLMYVAGGIGIGSASYSGLTSGFTQSQKVSSSGTGNRTGLSVYQVIPSSGSYSAAATLGTGSNSWSAMAVSIKAAAVSSGIYLIGSGGSLTPVTPHVLS